MLKKVRTLRIEQHPLSLEEVQDIAAAIRGELRTLELVDCSIDHASKTTLFEALSSRTHLQNLTLQRMRLTDEDAVAIAGALGAGSPLRALSVVDNPLGEGGARALIMLLQDKLQDLELPGELPDAVRSARMAILCARKNVAPPSPAKRSTSPGAGARSAPPAPETLEQAIRSLRALQRAPRTLLESADSAPLWAEIRTLRRARLARLHHEKREARAQKKAQRRAQDHALLRSTALRMQHRAADHAELNLNPIASTSPPKTNRLHRPRRCYVCKSDYRQVHHFYDALCVACGDQSFAKRAQTADLSGKVALLNGCRKKAGYQVALKLLRAGASVYGTTRFVGDALRRFSQEPDFLRLQPRLKLIELDLLNIPKVEALCGFLQSKLQKLDILINYAAQTVYKPPAYFRSARESSLTTDLERTLLNFDARSEQWPVQNWRKAFDETSLPKTWRDSRADRPDLFHRQPQSSEPRDLRSMNSWRLRLHEVGTSELLEVLLINVAAPFVFTGRLRALLSRASAGAHVVQVTAPEGRFQSPYKSARHPHVNMGKAALNMLTRTAAQDFAEDGIWMNCVDPGWISNDNPKPLADRMRDFSPPLDAIDAAARICDPIFSAPKAPTEADSQAEPPFGRLLKEFSPVSW